ncbi:MAG TPA: type II secretion system secretin GspD [Burkholderiales bacterium]|nr:type II secretion system secretin GspD [Burkholderiales bacterium]
MSAFRAVALALALLAPMPAGAQRIATESVVAKDPGPDLITLNFANADIESVVKAMSGITGKNFVVDPRVRGTINIVSASPVPRSAVYDVFLSALRVQGIAAVEDRGIVRIVPESDAKLHPAPTFGPQDKPRGGGDQIQTRVFTLQHESAAQLLPVLRPLIAPNNTIASYANTNSLIVTDYASNLRRIEKIIEAIDQPSGSDLAIIPLRRASATDVANTLNRVLAEGAPAQGADATQRLSIVADMRSNSVLVRSPDPARLSRVRTMVATLDSPTSAGGNIHVIYLKNADAVKLAETLRSVYSGGTAPQPQRTVATPPPPAGAPPPPPPPMAQTNTAPNAGAIIHADPATNSIIVTAPDAIYNDLRAAIEKLDVRRAQVYVEALVAEITAAKAAEFGIQWQSLSGANAPDGSTRAFGGTNFGGPGQNILDVSRNPGAAGSGLNIGVVRGRVTVPGVGEVLNLGLLVRALEADNNANILSTPTLLTLDNEEGRIVVGQNVPFITGSYAVSGAATTPTPFQTIERRDVGLTLRIRPQITEGGTVRMQIMQEVSSIQSVTNTAGIITNKRAVESTVLLDDGEIIVIGGLIQDSVSDGVEKVPVLGDIPWLGELFRYRTRSRSKTNLMVFLRPTVVRDTARVRPITEDRYDYISGEQTKVAPQPSSPLPATPSPTLPLRVTPELGK